MLVDQIIASLGENPHFELLPKDKAFQDEFKTRLEKYLACHKDDNEVLREESFYYILPAIAAYQTMKKYDSDPLGTFRQMWLHGARSGARFMQEAALEDSGFLQNWCQNIVPKQEDAGAFLFEIVTATSTEAEYHVKRCPYVEICREFSCPELITVFCDSDDISFGSIHPTLKWGRTKTLGHGADCCDFKFTYEG